MIGMIGSDLTKALNEEEFRNELILSLRQIRDNQQNHEFQEDIYCQLKQINENLAALNKHLKDISDILIIRSE